MVDAEIHRIRGEILLKKHAPTPRPPKTPTAPRSPSPSARKPRSFELRAAHSLAKLYQLTRRLAEAHAVLAPALQGFLPTPEMPEIAEAQALLATLAQSDDVKAATEQHRRRLISRHPMGRPSFGPEASRQKRPRRHSLASMKLSGLPKT